MRPQRIAAENGVMAIHQCIQYVVQAVIRQCTLADWHNTYSTFQFSPRNTSLRQDSVDALAYAPEFVVHQSIAKTTQDVE
jgi:hypothetical protein